MQSARRSCAPTNAREARDGWSGDHDFAALAKSMTSGCTRHYDDLDLSGDTLRLGPAPSRRKRKLQKKFRFRDQTAHTVIIMKAPTPTAVASMYAKVTGIMGHIGNAAIALSYILAIVVLFAVGAPLARSLENATRDGGYAVREVAAAVFDVAPVLAIGLVLSSSLAALGYVLKMTASIVSNLHAFGNRATLAAYIVIVSASLLVTVVGGVLYAQIKNAAVSAVDISSPTPNMRALEPPIDPSTVALPEPEKVN